MEQEGDGMSVIVKGMEMPQNCDKCKFQSDSRLYCDAMPYNFCGNTNDIERPDWCPLIELPPHGRLGDLDKLMTEFMDSDLDHLQRDDWKEVIQIVADAPTIIEAEGSDNG